MAGTKVGGVKAAIKILASDPLFYQKIGGKGGRNGIGSAKGFAANPELARKAGQKGGKTRKINFKKGNK